MCPNPIVSRLLTASSEIERLAVEYDIIKTDLPIAPVMDYIHTLEQLIGSMQLAFGFDPEEHPHVLPFPNE